MTAGKFAHVLTSGVLATLTFIPSAFASDAFDTASPWMLGDWNGARSRWLEAGVDLQFSYISEMAANLSGGYSGDHSGRYADQWGVGATLDLEKLLGWTDSKAQIQLANRNGKSLDNEIINDPRAAGMGSTQEIQGRGSVTRLTQFWMSKGWFDDALDVKAGRYTVGDEFAVQDCLFQSLAICGSQPGNYVSDIYNSPISSWALRVRYALTPALSAQIGAYRINPSTLDNDNGMKLRVHGSTGTLLPVEAIWTPSLAQLPGEYRLGYYYSTADKDDVYDDENGVPAAISGENYRSHSSHHGWWLTGKQQLTSRGGDRGLTLYGSLTFHDRATNPVDSYQHVSLVYRGLFDARPADTLGLGVARIHASERFRRNARAANAQSGWVYADAGYLPIQTTAYMAELNYGIQATGWLHVMPNLQYVKSPGGVRRVDNALVLGLQVSSTF